MKDEVEFKWFVMEPDGNGAIRKAKVTTGPYYNETSWFSDYGYDTKDHAKDAIRSYCSEFGNYCTFFIVEGT